MIKNVLMQEKVIKTAAKCAPENFLKKKKAYIFSSDFAFLHGWNIILG